MIWGYQCLLILLFDRKMICVYNRWDESIQHNGKWHGHSNFYSVSLNKICFSTLGIIYLNHSLEPAMLICNLSHTYFTMLTPIYQSVADMDFFVDNSIGNNILALFLQKSQPAPRNPHSRDTGRRFSGDMVKSSHFFGGDIIPKWKPSLQPPISRPNLYQI